MKRLSCPPQVQGTWSMQTANMIKWERQTCDRSMVQSYLERKPMTFAFNSTRFAFTFTEVTNELLSSVSVSSICIFPFLQCPSYISTHWMQYWTQNANRAKLQTFYRFVEYNLSTSIMESSVVLESPFVSAANNWTRVKIFYVWKHIKINLLPTFTVIGC